jgi:hypothetical protein
VYGGGLVVDSESSIKSLNLSKYIKVLGFQAQLIPAIIKHEI